METCRIKRGTVLPLIIYIQIHVLCAARLIWLQSNSTGHTLNPASPGCSGTQAVLPLCPLSSRIHSQKPSTSKSTNRDTGRVWGYPQLDLLIQALALLTSLVPKERVGRDFFLCGNSWSATAAKHQRILWIFNVLWDEHFSRETHFHSCFTCKSSSACFYC